MTDTRSLPVVPAHTARTLLMDAQGLLASPNRPASPARIYDQIEAMGFVQLDTIAVIERAHHHILFSRFERYRPATLARLHETERRLFEHMTHDASLIPSKWFPYWRARFQKYAASDRVNRHLAKYGDTTVRTVLERIRQEGPTMSRHFADRRETGNGAWWDWGPHKSALECLWRAGTLAVARRINFHKVYDLTERVFPAEHASPEPAPGEHLDWACRSALDRLIIATSGEVAAFWHAVAPAAAAAWCRTALKRGELVEVMVESADGSPPRRSYALANWSRRAAALREAPPIIRLLSPFDPVVRDRKRLQRLFGFGYRFEAFTPAPKRRYGYFVLPILEGDRIVGRLDSKAVRDGDRLDVLGLWWEPGIKPTRARRALLSDSLDRFAAFNGVRRWRLLKGAHSA